MELDVTPRQVLKDYVPKDKVDELLDVMLAYGGCMYFDKDDMDWSFATLIDEEDLAEEEAEGT